MRGKRKIVTVVPLHDELKSGTLLVVLKLAEIRKEDFIEGKEEKINIFFIQLNKKFQIAYFQTKFKSECSVCWVWLPAVTPPTFSTDTV